MAQEENRAVSIHSKWVPHEPCASRYARHMFLLDPCAVEHRHQILPANKCSTCFTSFIPSLFALDTASFPMFNKSALLLAVSLALSVCAVPSPAPEGVAVPIRARSALTTADGVFDHDGAIAETVKTINKHRQNLINLKKNKGEAFFNPGAEIKNIATVPAAVQARMESRHEKRQSLGLTDQSEEEWTGSVSIGTPATRFVIDFDTGSSDLWVPSSSCRSSCSGKTKYNPNQSSTSTRESGSFSIQYADGSTVSGPIYTDTVSVAGVSVTQQYLSGVTTLSSSFTSGPADGLLGLAFPAISNLGQDPYFQTAINEGAVSANQFGFYLASSGSSLYIGGTDTRKYSGSIEFNGITSSSGFWQVTGASVNVGGSTVASNLETIVDSGTTIMYGPPALVREIFAQVPGAQLYDSANGYYSYPCSNPPQISFNYGGNDWTISAANLNLGRTSSGSRSCVSSLAAQDLGLGSRVFLLGDAFMKNQYTVFDVDQNAVGFATL
ncbi:unnamed protein product [Mycena citricolor]|uniref:Peptidase A1 domain-containing protein n=1 Tax=Mycena citricolor TaxID=2018698 RepID=A0AAD2JY41_9AGAR|nr:unnamed protein product [Mycena citricolor]